MKITRHDDGNIVIQLDGSLGLRQVIALPKLVDLLPARAEVTLDFRTVRWERPAAVAVLIPALASLHRKAVHIIGLQQGAEAQLTAAAA